MGQAQQRVETCREELEANDIVDEIWTVVYNHIERDKYGWSGEIELNHYAAEPEDQYDWKIAAHARDEVINVGLIRKDPADLDHLDIEVLREMTVTSKKEAYDAINELVAEYDPY